MRTKLYVGGELGPTSAPEARSSKGTDGLSPAEDLLDAFSNALTDAVALLGRGATIEHGVLILVSDMGRDPALSTSVDEVSRVVSLVGTEGDAVLTRKVTSSLSICANIAEGAGEFSSDAKASFYRIASRSATECAAILDAGRRVNIVSVRLHAEGRDLLLRIVSMLTKLAERHNTL